MRFRSPQAKPQTGMEMTVTLSMPVDQDTQQCADALIRFMEGVNALSAETGAAWIKIRCDGIPEELEDRLECAIHPKRAQLELVVNNIVQRPSNPNTGE